MKTIDKTIQEVYLTLGKKVLVYSLDNKEIVDISKVKYYN